jgi:hypothetical protein
MVQLSESEASSLTNLNIIGLDQTNFTPALDHQMEDMMYPFSPFFNLLQLSEPLKLSSVAAMTDGIVASASEWLDREKRTARL